MENMKLYNGACDVLDEAAAVALETGASKSDVLKAMKVAALIEIGKTLEKGLKDIEDKLSEIDASLMYGR